MGPRIEELIHCSSDIDCLSEEQCSSIEPIYDDNDNLQSSVCLPLSCHTNCPTVGDPCVDGSLSGACNYQTMTCEYENVINLSQCIEMTPATINYEELVYCKIDDDCTQEGLESCHYVKNLRHGVCSPYYCNDEDHCPTLGAKCHTPVIKGECKSQVGLCVYAKKASMPKFDC